MLRFEIRQSLRKHLRRGIFCGRVELFWQPYAQAGIFSPLRGGKGGRCTRLGRGGRLPSGSRRGRNKRLKDSLKRGASRAENQPDQENHSENTSNDHRSIGVRNSAIKSLTVFCTSL